MTGNFIGTDVTGTLGLGNFNGVDVSGPPPAPSSAGPRPADSNLIAANYGDAVDFLDTSAAGNVVLGNSLGLGAGGGALGNFGNGVYLENSSGVQIGGQSAGSANVISANYGSGVFLGIRLRRRHRRQLHRHRRHRPAPL